MITIYPEHLQKNILSQGRCANCYFLIGNEPLLMQESIEAIQTTSITYGFKEHISIIIDTKTNWDELFTNCYSLNLFTKRQTLTLQIPEDGVNTTIAAQLLKLSYFLHSDIVLIICMKILIKAENTSWFKQLNKQAVLVPCHTPHQNQIQDWVANRAKIMKLAIDDASIQLLCYCYEGNLSELVLVLKHLSLLWPDDIITLSRTTLVVNNSTRFTALHWTDALLIGESIRALHILDNLEKKNMEIIILIRLLQHDLLSLIYLQQNQNKNSLCELMNKKRIWPNRRFLFINALKRLDKCCLEHAIILLAQLVLIFKHEINQDLWIQLKNISLLLCNQNFPMSFTHE
ncbi:DNA polymerase III subunit delta [Pantoea sp. Mhis]|uniref:DNA polymerase III subunit delta n=1 Tax=Pantoea sp. Mhis TaxID=2576759 RepID=UPI001356A50E|nr:DNA polymerase III subunit delta [Pantoea sp. Mhis]MXP56270.1 DNA polymerase III subunit delta [Pantoea sp. Mhis]